ncbi:Protein of unknown function [Gryllus bimaculatus]|nr:Protein of unknown function [Gryllus bimaculatus]
MLLVKVRVVKGQLKDGRCKLPEDAGVQEKLAKYSMCSLLNSGELGTTGARTQNGKHQAKLNDTTEAQ